MARYLAKHKVLFQHIPRTGGSWVEKAVGEMRGKHHEGIRISKMLQKQPPWIPKKHALLSHYRRSTIAEVEHVFAFVRHPIQYYESVWKWMRRQDPVIRKLISEKWTWHPHMEAVRWYLETRQGRFDDWVFMMLEHEPAWYTRMVEQYVGPEGGEFCDFIGRTERLETDFVLAMNIYGYGPEAKAHSQAIGELGRVNAIEGNLFWTDATKDGLVISERKMLRRFYGDNANRRLYNGLDPKNAARLAEKTAR